MSDYISKSALIDSIVQNVIITTEEGLDLRSEIVNLIKNQPTVDEKEIIRKAFERVVERLDAEKNRRKYQIEAYGIQDSIEIVKEEGGIE